MKPFGFFERRVRGFRVVEVGGLGVLLVLILAVYLAKTGAGGKRADIDHIQAQIFDEQTQIRLLRAEVATLEQPQRLEALATHYLGLQPISVRREVTAAGLQDVAQVTVINSKLVATQNDPLVAKGSPDLPGADAPPPVLAAPDAPPAPTNATPAVSATAPAATVQPVALKPAPKAKTPAANTAQAPPAAHHAASAKVADATPTKVQPAALKRPPAAAAKATTITIARADAAPRHAGRVAGTTEPIGDGLAPTAEAPASAH